MTPAPRRLISVGRTYTIRTFGCQMNEHDSERLAGLLEGEGYARAVDPEQADLYVLNTCCIRENADNKLYGALGHLKRVKERRPDVRILVAGCLAQKDRQLIRERAPHVDVVVGTHNLHRAPYLLRHAEAVGPIVEVWDHVEEDDVVFPSALPARRQLAHAAWITIQIGCDNSCAFCIVPSVRGPEVSRPFGEIVDEARRLADQGVVEVTLLGQNVNSYGRDITTKLRKCAPDPSDVWLAGERWAKDSRRRARPLFADLLRAVGEIPGIRRVRFTSPHPKDLGEETMEAMAEVPSICPHLHLPLQSGSDRILAAMHRGYTASRYLEKLEAARERIPDLAVTTDIIVGFPGETEEDFAQTLDVVSRARYDGAYTFVFSPRPGTEAASMVDRFVPEDVAADRFERLCIVTERSAAERHRERVGRIEEVLVEGPSPKQSGVWLGRTPQNKLVHLSGSDPLQPGTFVEAEIQAAGRHHLKGSVARVLRRPARAVRIPLEVVPAASSV
ncbi:MAG: tRNA-2-methylthio-N(6)-dimethylallyladenosine synthase [Acidimicrobiales bacterium]|nr:MAG: tRNA-2-methylthio-N(6)-dimethylallyladenosine synthase [Acidimicrobiales bacterium]